MRDDGAASEDASPCEWSSHRGMVDEREATGIACDCASVVGSERQAGSDNERCASDSMTQEAVHR